MRHLPADLPPRTNRRNPPSIRYRMFDIRYRMVSSGRMARGVRERNRNKAARLDAAAWIAAAFDALAEGGIDAVRVEPLAKALGITKGSFYWHFADRRALLDAMLDAWAQGRIAAIREQATVARRARPRCCATSPTSTPATPMSAASRSSSRSARSPAPMRPPRKPCAASTASGCSMSASCSRALGWPRARRAGARDPVLQLSVRAEPARRQGRAGGSARQGDPRAHRAAMIICGFFTSTLTLISFHSPSDMMKARS